MLLTGGGTITRFRLAALWPPHLDLNLGTHDKFPIFTIVKARYLVSLLFGS
jgi:hypothetical protein